jgi:hypothetical protein
MIDANGKMLAVGDPVTVSYPSDRPIFHRGSHGQVLSFGTKRVKVKLTTAAFASRDGDVETFMSEDLEHGHHGIPRHEDRITDVALGFGANRLAEVLGTAIEEGVINSAQGERIHELWQQQCQY